MHLKISILFNLFCVQILFRNASSQLCFIFFALVLLSNVRRLTWLFHIFYYQLLV